MLKYFIDQTSVTLELAILSAGYTVTGRTPTCLIRRRSDDYLFDFSNNTFTTTAAAVSATAVLESAIEGLYNYTWDISGQFTTSTMLLFEYHDATCLTIEDVWITRPPLSTGDAAPGIPGAAIMGGKGVWTQKEKEKIIDDVKKIKDSTINFRREAMLILKDLLDRPSITIDDLQVVTEIKERDLEMYQDLLRILELRDTSTEKEIFEKLSLYIKKEEKAKAVFIKELDKLIGIDDEDEEDD